MSVRKLFLVSSIEGEHPLIRGETQVARSRAFSHVILRVFSGPFFLFCGNGESSVNCHNRLLSSISDAIGININESSERATPRERNEMGLENEIP
jgi:hypothetical protein